jgi:hypothetical protein
MVAFNFSPEHATKVESGEKLQTIRQTLRGKPGDRCQLLTGQRTKACRKLRLDDPPLVMTDYVGIRPDGLTFGNRDKHPGDIDECARLDGFADFAAMVAWFKAKYGSPFFTGYLHRWAPLPGQH